MSQNKLIELVYEKSPQPEILLVKWKYGDWSLSERVLKVFTVSKEQIKNYENAVVSVDNIFRLENSKEILKSISD